MKKFLLALIVILVLPSDAKATTTAGISCNARLSLQNGTRITYQISGSMEFTDGGQIFPTNEPNLFITILRRERNGTERVLRSQEQLGNWELDAPDADYSLLPFSGSFRTRPNDGSGIYHVRSADHGIYIRMIPSNSSPRQIQVLHYLSRGKFVRSAASPCSLEW
jgi:hypothetical protein